MPVICLAVIAGTVIVSIPSFEAMLGHGTPGYFVAQSQSCTTVTSGQPPYYIHTCTWHGEFERAAGHAINTDSNFDGSYPAMRAGTRVPVLSPDPSLGGTVYPRHGNWTWLGGLLFGLFALGGSGVYWNVQIAKKVIRRIRAPRAILRAPRAVLAPHLEDINKRMMALNPGKPVTGKALFRNLGEESLAKMWDGLANAGLHSKKQVSLDAVATVVAIYMAGAEATRKATTGSPRFDGLPLSGPKHRRPFGINEFSP
jgi:hypothetical protein